MVEMEARLGREEMVLEYPSKPGESSDSSMVGRGLEDAVAFCSSSVSMVCRF